MNWQKVIDDLRATANDGSTKADEIVKRQPHQRIPGNDRMVDDRAATIERHRINANFCFALAMALEAGLDET